MIHTTKNSKLEKMYISKGFDVKLHKNVNKNQMKKIILWDTENPISITVLL